MNLLLDTCAFLWATGQSERLSDTARAMIDSRENILYLSAVSVWEIALKHSLGTISLRRPPAAIVGEGRKWLGVLSLPLDEAAALLSAGLPLHHKDPFDRMLVCQAMFHEMAVLTPDPLIRRYSVQCLW